MGRVAVTFTFVGGSFVLGLFITVWFYVWRLCLWGGFLVVWF